MIVALSLVQMDERFGGSPPAPAAAIDDLFEPFHIINPYGLFAVMTTDARRDHRRGLRRRRSNGANTNSATSPAT